MILHAYSFGGAIAPPTPLPPLHDIVSHNNSYQTFITATFPTLFPSAENTSVVWDFGTPEGSEFCVDGNSAIWEPFFTGDIFMSPEEAPLIPTTSSVRWLQDSDGEKVMKYGMTRWEKKHIHVHVCIGLVRNIALVSNNIFVIVKMT